MVSRKYLNDFETSLYYYYHETQQVSEVSTRHVVILEESGGSSAKITCWEGLNVQGSGQLGKLTNNKWNVNMMILSFSMKEYI